MRLLAREKNKQITASFLISPVKNAAFVLLVVSVFSALPSMAFAELPGFREGAPGWELTARSYPTNFSPILPTTPQVSGTIAVDVFNIGASAAACTISQHTAEEAEAPNATLCPEGAAGTPALNPITMTDRLPPGVRAVEAGELDAVERGGVEPELGHELWECAGNGGGPPPHVQGASVVTCTNKATKDLGEEPDLGAFAGGGGAPTEGSSGLNNLQPVIGISVDIQADAAERETNEVSIAGGGADNAASTTDPITISAARPPFTIVGWDGWFSNADGTLDAQAGSHPYEATFSFDLASILSHTESNTNTTLVSGGEIKTAEVELPPGLVGDPTAVPQCPRSRFDSEECPQASIIGTTTVYPTNFRPIGLRVFNLIPPPGVPAEFGFTLQNLNTYLDASVRSGGDYGITEHVSAIANKEVLQVVTTLWGEPGAPSHNLWRNGVAGGCLRTALETAARNNSCQTTNEPVRKPFLTLPTACGAPPRFVIHATSWTGATSDAVFYMHDADDDETGISECQDLAFGPSLSFSPDTSQADTPTGLDVEVDSPIGGLQESGGLSSSPIEHSSVVLPRGFVVNPGQAAGLQACKPGEDGLTTEAERIVGAENDGAPSCPPASRIGSVKANSPLLEGASEKELEGSLYLLQSNPPDVKVLAAFAADGVNIKLVLDAELNEQTGQITTTVSNVPDLPATTFKLSFNGGVQATLDTPTSCGAYTTTSDFTPWSSPFTGDAFPTSVFEITAGVGGGGCPSSPLAFTPTLTAGATSTQAGAFTNFSMVLQRGDGQQRIDGLKFKAPEGLTGFISKVPLCTNAQAESNTCPEASKIGHTVVESGPGPYPLVVPEPSRGEEAPIYLTESYDGAPFGLSVVVPLKVGPFTLKTQRVRARIEVNPTTSALTITTNPLPQLVDGVPTDLREINAVIERPEFMVNPTNCNPSEFSGTAYGTPPPGQNEPNTTASISSHFGVGACRSLEFSPKFSVSTSGKTSKADGASLTAKVTYPNVPQGTEADIAAVKVDLPRALPSRLKTLQKACTNAQFELNPANCPPASFIGHATVHTPLLPVPLTGPAIFVSHGGEAFPSLTIVLQGDGVTIELVGATYISPAGITSTTFKTVPDDPFSSFELTLPEGPYSALAANGNLCKPTTTKTVSKKVTVKVKGHTKTVTRKVEETVAGSLIMPTAFVAQNGAEIHENTTIAVTNCPKAVKAKKAKKKKAKRKKKKS